MIKSLYLKNFMLFDEIEFNDFSPINLFIGENDTGKTSVLKVLYSIASGVELFSYRKRTKFSVLGYAPGSELWIKLRDVFSNRDIIKSTEIKSGVKCEIENDNNIEKIEIRTKISDANKLQRDWGETKDLNVLYNFNAIFIPPKEILSIKNAIKISQATKSNDFDTTYYDLVTYIEGNKNIEESEKLNVFKNYDNNYDFYNGNVRLIEDENGGKRPVFFKNDVLHYEIDIVAEGIRKLGIFPILEKSGHLTKKTILFVDEPENSVHPKALRELMRFFYDISKEGVQIFIASHNQFVVQQLRNIAKINDYSINCYSLLKENEKIICNKFDLKDEMAENPILDAAIKMFDESVIDG